MASSAANKIPKIMADAGVLKAARPLDDTGQPVTPRLEVKHLVKRMNGVAVVDGVDLDIQPGESLVLLGPSGCGKTTTLRMIAGLIQPDGGEIRLDGRLVAGAGARTTVNVPTDKRRLGMVFQNYAVWPHKTVFGNVAYGLKLARVSGREIKSRVAGALALVQLAGLEERYPSSLSGGQQQRVALARAIVTEPALLLLDEPLSNLDATLRKEMRIELKELARRIGMTCLYVTHDQEEALTLADRVVVMNKGRIEQIATPEDIYRRPKTRFVAGFVGTTNLIEGKVREQDRHGGRLKIETGIGLEFWSRASADTIESSPPGTEVAVSVRPEGIRIGTETSFNAAGLKPVPTRFLGSSFLGNRYELRLELQGTTLHGQAASLEALRDNHVHMAIDEALAWVVR
jgi:ABC-type Fe3+/spermidine/putrescine transport system ATPase subunit